MGILEIWTLQTGISFRLYPADQDGGLSKVVYSSHNIYQRVFATNAIPYKVHLTGILSH
jgi:hypothetical protein